jgi:hypothetical protein
MSSTLTLDVPAGFSAFCATHQLSPVEVLAVFMGDMAETSENSDRIAHRCLDDWFNWTALPSKGLRGDGEPLTGIDAIDYPPDLAPLYGKYP